MKWWIQTLALIVIIPAFFKLVDWFISIEQNRAMKNRVTDLWIALADFSYRDAIYRSLIYCNDLFSRIYGRRHFTIRCFLTSCAVSIFFAFSLFLLLGMLSGIDFTIKRWGYCAGWALSINILADYISLIETRLILRYAEKIHPFHLSGLLAFDLVCTSGIFILFLWLALSVGQIEHGDLGYNIYREEIVTHFVQVIKDPLKFPLNSALAYTTFTTSVLFYLYCILAVGLKAFGLVKTPIAAFLQNLQEKDRFLTAVGIFLSIAIFIICAITKFVQDK